MKLPTYAAGPREQAKAPRSAGASRDAKHLRHHTDMLGLFTASIDRLVDNDTSVTVFSQDEKFMSSLLRANRGHRKNLAFEVPLGYNAKRVNALIKSKANVGVYVSYGKDWIPYAINRLTEGRIRDIAMALLDGEHKGVAHVEQQGR